jgi:hypothetical protein
MLVRHQPMSETKGHEQKAPSQLAGIAASTVHRKPAGVKVMVFWQSPGHDVNHPLALLKRTLLLCFSATQHSSPFGAAPGLDLPASRRPKGIESI